MDEYLIIYGPGAAPDAFAICQGRDDFEVFLAYCKKHHWPVRRTARLVEIEETS